MWWILFTVVPALVGFVFGYFLAGPLLILITIFIAILAFVLRPQRHQEIGAVVGIVVWYVLGVATFVMWSTYFYQVGFPDLGLPDLTSYIFRK